MQYPVILPSHPSNNIYVLECDLEKCELNSSRSKLLAE